MSDDKDKAPPVETPLKPNHIRLKPGQEFVVGRKTFRDQYPAALKPKAAVKDIPKGAEIPPVKDSASAGSDKASGGVGDKKK